METITYRMIRRQKVEVLNFWTAILLGTFFLVSIVVESFRSGGLTEAWSHQPFFRSMNMLIVLLSLVAVVLFFFGPQSRARLVFQLDKTGLTYGPRQWRWDELSAFKLQGRWMGRHIVFAVPGQANWLTRFNAANLGLPEGPLVRIQDIYDTPLDDIAAKLNEYRERALGGGAETSETQSPELA